MADQAVGRNCPNDGTLTACAGSYTDEFLVGVCAYCNGGVITPNPYYKKPFADENGPADAASEQIAASIHNYGVASTQYPVDEADLEQAPVVAPVDEDDLEPAPDAQGETANA
jgi:hypothetical protein